MKLFKTSSTDIINECRVNFKIKLVSEAIVNRKRKFLSKYIGSTNSMCLLFATEAQRECDVLNLLCH